MHSLSNKVKVYILNSHSSSHYGMRARLLLLLKAYIHALKKG